MHLFSDFLFVGAMFFCGMNPKVNQIAYCQLYNPLLVLPGDKQFHKIVSVAQHKYLDIMI